VPACNLGEAGQKLRAAYPRVFHQALVPDHVKHRETHGGRNGIATERIEIPRLLSELPQQIWPRDHSGKRVAVAQRLAAGDNIWRDIVTKEGPHGLARTRETGLHLVGDEQRASLLRGPNARGNETARIGI